MEKMNEIEQVTGTEKFGGKPVTFDKINVTGGFWKEKQDLFYNITMKAVYDRFEETGRFEALKFNWKEGMPNKPHIYPRAVDLCGRGAVTRGPLVYCAESTDNNYGLRDVRISRTAGYAVKLDRLCNVEVPVIYTKASVREVTDQLYMDETAARKEIPLKLIPYFTRANRGITEMSTWFLLED